MINFKEDYTGTIKRLIKKGLKKILPVERGQYSIKGCGKKPGLYKKAKIKELKLLFRTHEKAGNYEDADRSLTRILEIDPRNLHALQKKAELNFKLGQWEQSVSDYIKLEKQLEKDQVSGDKKTEKLWLAANKRIIHALLNQKKKKEAIYRRQRIFDKLNGQIDVVDIYKRNCGSAPEKIETEMFRSGLSSFYSCAHHPGDHFESIVEKCCIPESNEPEIYKIINKYDLFKSNHLIRTPELKGVIERDNYLKLFLSYESGFTLSKSGAMIDYVKLGSMLAEIGKEFCRALNAQKVELPPLKKFSSSVIFNYFRNYQYDEVKKCVQVIEEFYNQKDKLELIRNKLPRSFAHNDNGLQNILLKENGQHILFDWERAAFNSIGSDLGHVLGSGILKKAENKGFIAEMERQMVDGYMNAISGLHLNVNKEDLIFSYNLQFVNAKLRGALVKHDFVLLKNIAQRCKLLNNLAGF